MTFFVEVKALSTFERVVTVEICLNIKVYINKNYAFKISLIENRCGRNITQIVYTSTIIHEYQSTLY